MYYFGIKNKLFGFLWDLLLSLLLLQILLFSHLKQVKAITVSPYSITYIMTVDFHENFTIFAISHTFFFAALTGTNTAAAKHFWYFFLVIYEP